MKLLGGTKISFLDFLFVFCIIIYAASASKFVRGYGNLLYLSTYIPLLFAIVLGVKHRIKIKNELFIAIGVFFAYFILASLVNGYLSGGFVSYWIITLIISYVMINCFGKQYFAAYETIVLYLTIIATAIWGVYLFIPDTVVSFCKQFQFSESFTDELDAINIIFYTHLDYAYGFVGDEIHTFPRNSGFAFEPGAFASMICFAIACNVIRNNGLRIRNNFPFLVFMGALFTTESTTGGITFILIIIFWLFANRGSGRTYLYLIFLIPLGIWVFSQGFVGAKMFNELSYSRQVSYTSGGDSGTGRFLSFLLYFQNFLDRPIFGNAGDPNTYLSRIGYQYSIHSGFGELLSDFGAIMTIVFFMLLARSVKMFKKFFGNSSVVLLAAIIGSMVSYSQWHYPAIFVFIIFDLFYSDDVMLDDTLPINNKP